MKMIRIPNSETSLLCLCTFCTQPPLHTRLVGLYPTHLWVPWRSVETEREGWVGDGEAGRDSRDACPKVSKTTPFPPYQLTPGSPTLRLVQQGVLWAHISPQPHLHPRSS